MRRRIGELEKESRRAQTTITKIRNERDESRQFSNTMNRANEGLRRSLVILEQQAAGATNSSREELQNLMTEMDNAMARTTTLRSEIVASIAERGTIEE